MGFNQKNKIKTGNQYADQAQALMARNLRERKKKKKKKKKKKTTSNQ
jgi:hypothetical protein